MRLACSPQPSEQPKPVKITETIKESLRFPIIDDITMNRTMLRRRLLKNIASNSSAMEAVNGEEALKICASTPQEFDIIVVDQYMEEAGGVMLGTDVVMAMKERIKSIALDAQETHREPLHGGGLSGRVEEAHAKQSKTINQLSFLIEQRARNGSVRWTPLKISPFPNVDSKKRKRSYLSMSSFTEGPEWVSIAAAAEGFLFKPFKTTKLGLCASTLLRNA